MILKKVYISRGGGGVKANLEKVYILIFFFMTASLTFLCARCMTQSSGANMWGSTTPITKCSKF